MSANKTQIGGNHYKNMPIQPAEFCQRNSLNYCESNVVKYVSRHRQKNGREDIEKAIHYLQLLIYMEYPETESEKITSEKLKEFYREDHDKTGS